MEEMLCIGISLGEDHVNFNFKFKFIVFVFNCSLVNKNIQDLPLKKLNTEKCGGHTIVDFLKTVRLKEKGVCGTLIFTPKFSI